MSLGPAPASSAHAHQHPLGPRRDRDVECKKPPVPAVPRARRAAPRGNSAGALTRDLWSKESSLASTPTKCSESRRPREDSPFTTHKRVSSLGREVEAPENQVFEMGPRRTQPATAERDHSRGHVLGGLDNGRMGMPWKASVGAEDPLAGREPARRNLLQHERVQAAQEFEWAPGVRASAGPVGQEVGHHGRMDLMRREVLTAEETGPALPGARSCSLPPPGPGREGHGRRNIMARETATQSVDMPLAGGAEIGGGVPFYGRRNILHKEQPRMAVPG